MQLGRWATGLALGGLLLGLGGTGLAQAWTTRLTVAALRVFGFDGVGMLGADHFQAGGRTYAVVLACTPVALTLCGLVLLGLAGSRAGVYLAEGFALLVAGWLLLTLNTALSVRLHASGLSWTWAHYPGLVTVYAGLLGLCLTRAVRGRT